MYRARFTINFPNIRAVLINLRTTIIGRRPRFPLQVFAPSAKSAASPQSRRKVWFADGWADAPIYRREDLAVGQALAGPAIVQQADTTVLVEPGWTARVDDIGNLRIETSS